MKSLGKILQNFNKTVAQLEELEARNKVTAESKRQKANVLIHDAESKELEAEKSAKVRDNIQKLLGD